MPSQTPAPAPVRPSPCERIDRLGRRRPVPGRCCSRSPRRWRRSPSWAPGSPSTAESAEPAGGARSVPSVRPRTAGRTRRRRGWPAAPAQRGAVETEVAVEPAGRRAAAPELRRDEAAEPEPDGAGRRAGTSPSRPSRSQSSPRRTRPRRRSRSSPRRTSPSRRARGRARGAEPEPEPELVERGRGVRRCRRAGRPDDAAADSPADRPPRSTVRARPSRAADLPSPRRPAGVVHAWGGHRPHLGRVAVRHGPAGTLGPTRRGTARGAGRAVRRRRTARPGHDGGGRAPWPGACSPAAGRRAPRRADAHALRPAQLRPPVAAAGPPRRRPPQRALVVPARRRRASCS